MMTDRIVLTGDDDVQVFLSLIFSAQSTDKGMPTAEHESARSPKA